MKFNDITIFEKERCSLGEELDSGRHYLSFPVFNGYVDYEEYYAISETEFDGLSKDAELRGDFLAKCRAHKMDDRLMIKPGDIRGDPC